MGNQPRVLHISSLALSRGGIETFLENMTKGFARHYDVVVASNGNQSFVHRIQILGGRTASWGANNALDMYAYQRLKRLIEQEQPSLIHIHDARAGWIARLLLATKHIPVITTVHLPSYYYRRDKFTGIWRITYAIMETTLNHLLTTKVIYPSLSGYEYALKWKIVPAKKAVYIPNGIDIGQFSMDPMERSTFRKRMQVEPGQIVICAIGRLSIEKNFSLIIKSFALIQASHPHTCLWIVGDGPERANLEEQVKARGLVKRVHFFGGEANVGLALASCDIFTLASWYEGGRTLAVMEAQIFGKPCVVSGVGDLPLMVQNGIHGFVFSDGDAEACAQALESLLENASRRDEMGHAAREKALQEYGLNKMVQGYDQLYRSLL